MGIRQQPGARPATGHYSAYVMLELTAVTKRFGRRVVLHEVSLQVASGEYVAVVGESGIGKSTLLNIIAGLEPADAGSVRVDGVEVSALDDDAATRLRRDRFGFVFQAIERRAAALVAAVGLAGREASAPRELSGGELQRVAIARALVGDPKLVLADEPTGNLDPENARHVLELLRAQVKERGASAILVTHSEAAAAGCDRRYRLSLDGLERLD
jgi:putative ABC transport system ATP-binding protein